MPLRLSLPLAVGAMLLLAFVSATAAQDGDRPIIVIDRGSGRGYPQISQDDLRDMIRILDLDAEQKQVIESLQAA